MRKKKKTTSSKESQETQGQETKHGGKRKGSGRKPKFKEETTTIAFRVPKSKVVKVKKLVKDYLQTIARENSNS